MPSHHQEPRTVGCVDIALGEAGELLELMSKGIRKVNPTLTIYHKSGKVQAEDPADVVLDTLVPATAREFELEARAGTPYCERIVVVCRGRGGVRIDVEGNSEEWALGKLGIISRYLKQRRKSSQRWFSLGLWVWLVFWGLLAVYGIEWLRARSELISDVSIKSLLEYGKWFLTGFIFLVVGRWLGATSILRVRTVPIYRRSLVWEVLVPIASGLVANSMFELVRRYVPR